VGGKKLKLSKTAALKPAEKDRVFWFWFGEGKEVQAKKSSWAFWQSHIEAKRNDPPIP